MQFWRLIGNIIKREIYFLRENIQNIHILLKDSASKSDKFENQELQS